jgi:hypothetical protein
VKEKTCSVGSLRKSYGASDIEGKIKNVPCGSMCDSDSEISSDDSTLYSGATIWGVNDKTSNLGYFTGNSGVKEIPIDPSNVHSAVGCCSIILCYVVFTNCQR